VGIESWRVNYWNMFVTVLH